MAAPGWEGLAPRISGEEASHWVSIDWRRAIFKTARDEGFRFRSLAAAGAERVQYSPCQGLRREASREGKSLSIGKLSPSPRDRPGTGVAGEAPAGKNLPWSNLTSPRPDTSLTHNQGECTDRPLWAKIPGLRANYALSQGGAAVRLGDVPYTDQRENPNVHDPDNPTHYPDATYQ
jgi:hypothetical protein